MHLFDNTFTSDALLHALDILLKLGIAVVLGGAIGWERERAGRPAGVRTHMLMVLGVTLICEVSKDFGGAEPSRIAAQIVTGVGFLGAGTIMRTGAEIKGLTTAASLWAAAAIGFAVSVGGAYLIVAGAATVLVLFTLAVVDSLERRIAPDSHPKDLQVELESRASLAALIEAIEDAGCRVLNVRILSSSPTFAVQIGVSGHRDGLLERAASVEGVRSAEWMD